MNVGNKWFLTYKPYECWEDERAPWLLKLINAPIRMVLGVLMNVLTSIDVMPTFVKKALMMVGFFIARLIPFIWMFVKLCVYNVYRCIVETTANVIILIAALLIFTFVSKIIVFFAALTYCFVILFVKKFDMDDMTKFIKREVFSITCLACFAFLVIPIALFAPELVCLILITPLLFLRPVQELIIEPAYALIWFAYAVVSCDVRELKDPAIKLDEHSVRPDSNTFETPKGRHSNSDGESVDYSNYYSEHNIKDPSASI